MSPSRFSPSMIRHTRATGLFILAISLIVVQAACQSTTRVVHTSEAPSQRGTSAFDRGPIVAGNSPKLQYAAARLLIARGQDQRAYELLTEIIRVHPAYLPSHVELAQLHLRRHRVDSAIITLTDALAIAPNDPVLHNDLGVCWMIKDRYDNAVVHFESAVAAAPDVDRYRANRAIALAMLGRDEEALDEFRIFMSENLARENIAILTGSRDQTLTDGEPGTVR